MYFLQGYWKKGFTVIGILILQRASEGLKSLELRDCPPPGRESDQWEKHPFPMHLWESQSCFYQELAPLAIPECIPTLLLRKSLIKHTLPRSMYSTSITMTIIIKHFLNTYYVPDGCDAISSSLYVGNCGLAKCFSKHNVHMNHPEIFSKYKTWDKAQDFAFLRSIKWCRWILFHRPHIKEQGLFGGYETCPQIPSY